MRPLRATSGQATSAYYGGRAEARIRRTPVPVLYTDYLSMYPTVNTRTRSWEALTAAHLEVADATEDVRELLARVTLEDVLDPSPWPQLRCFARVQPDGDILPVRGTYSSEAVGYQIGVNPYTSVLESWYSLPDLIAAKLLTGKTPRVLEAWRLEPVGRQAQLRPVRLRGGELIDPAREDFFRHVIEACARARSDPALMSDERGRQQRFLKVLANSGNCGIFAEMNRDTNAKPQKLTVYAGDHTFTTKALFDKPGAFAVPPQAALTTAGARLMLATLECLVTALGGTYAFCDTDSLAIVATEHGGLVACPGGPHTLPDGRSAIHALSWAQVDAIAEQIDRLNPYDRTFVRDRIIKIESGNYDPDTGRRRQLHAFVISAKRYALFNLNPDGSPVIRKASEHGLGHLLDPTKGSPDDNTWIDQTWLHLIDGLEVGGAKTPARLGRMAVTRTTLTTPHVHKAFDTLNAGRAYPDSIKPFNFILAAHVAPMGHPVGADAGTFHLIAPFVATPAGGRASPGSTGTTAPANEPKPPRATRTPQPSRRTITCSPATPYTPRARATAPTAASPGRPSAS